MTYYIKIEKPIEFRRDILESSKKIVASLQDFRNVMFIREKKKKLLEELKIELKEINLLITNLNKLLPEKQLREEALRNLKKKKVAEKVSKTKASKKNVSKKKEVVEEKTPPKPKPKVASETDKLDSALANIEKKLANLG